MMLSPTSIYMIFPLSNKFETLVALLNINDIFFIIILGFKYNFSLI